LPLFKTSSSRFIANHHSSYPSAIALLFYFPIWVLSPFLQTIIPVFSGHYCSLTGGTSACHLI
jgi:hypothetical protein